jgi:hypothetical protein
MIRAGVSAPWALSRSSRLLIAWPAARRMLASSDSPSTKSDTAYAWPSTGKPVGTSFRNTLIATSRPSVLRANHAALAPVSSHCSV